MDFEVREPANWAEYLECEEVQRQVWRSPDNRDIVPASLLITAHKNGGLLLGAFASGRMVGFVFGFLGSEKLESATRLKHCSHMLAVLSEWRGRGVALGLKVRQRELLLHQGLELATWTYDPLQAANARLNLVRLGAIARRYVRNAYGEMGDILNSGVASDRFEVEWWIKNTRVAERLPEAKAAAEEATPTAERLFQIALDRRGMPVVSAVGRGTGQRLLVEIPPDWNALRSADPGLAQAWREWTRAAFEDLFSRGYSATGFMKWAEQGQRAGYLLQSFSVDEIA